MKNSFKLTRRCCMILAALFLVLVTGIILLCTRLKTKDDDTWLLRIDGVEIPKEEYLLFLNDQKAMTAAYFSSEYGMTPIAYAKDKALEELVLAKEEAILADELGIIEDPSYAQVLLTLQDKNTDHAKKQEEGEAYYGLTEYNDFTGYQYLRAVTMTGITEEWVRRASPDSGVLYTIYEDHIELFGQGTEFTFRVCYIDGSQEEFTVTEFTIGKEDYETQALIDAFFTMEAGEVIEGGSYRGLQADIELISKKSLGYRSFEDCREVLVRIYAEEDLDQALKRRAEDAKIEINQRQYELIRFTEGGTE